MATRALPRLSPALRVSVLLAALLICSSAGAGGPDGPRGPVAADRAMATTAAPPAVKPALTAIADLTHAHPARPVAFEPNRGQTDPRVAFLAHGPGYTVFLTPGEVVLALRGGPPDVARAAVVRMELVGANPRPQIVPGDALPGRASYFIGNDPARWRTGIPTYARVRYRDVYPGVDLEVYSRERQLEYDFVVAPGADPRAIRLALHGATRIALDEQGDLVLDTAAGTIRQHRPRIYQDVGGRRRAIAGGYVLAEGHRVGFHVAAHDATAPLVIDPVLSYSTYLGGSLADQSFGIAVDPAGNAYIAGYTASSDFPTRGAIQPAPPGQGDAFVAKFGPDGTLLYSTYLGGGYVDHATDIAVDAQGNAYVTGFTGSSDFPTRRAYQPRYAGNWDAFVTKIDATGSALVYSTYLGGSGQENRINAGIPGAIAVDAHGSAYVTGDTQSPDFPTVNPYQATLRGSLDAFVAKFSPDGRALVYSTYLGGERGETGWGIAVDGDGHAIVTGDTTSVGFPTANAFQPSCAPSFVGCHDVFVTKLDPTGAALVYSTYLGGNDREYVDRGFAVAVDAAGVAYVTGMTGSPNFPTRAPYQFFYGGQVDAFVAAFGPTGTLLYSTYLGGSNSEVGYGIAVSRAGNVHLSGLTLSTDFPLANPIQPALRGFEDAFVTILSGDGQRLVFSTYLGGSTGREEWGSTGIALDGAGNIYITGMTEATDFPTVKPHQPAPRGSYDAFVTRIDPGASSCAGTGSLRISGKVRTPAGEPVAGVTMTLDGPGGCSDAAATTARGRYRFPTLGSGTYTITPGRLGCTFTPASRTVTLSGANARANFRASCS